MTDDTQQPSQSDAAGTGAAATMHVKRFALGPFATNCYLVWSEAGEASGERLGLIVDAGFGAEAMAKEAIELGVRIERVVLTHAHADHIGGLDALRDVLAGAGQSPPVSIHANERAWLVDPELNLSSGFGVPLRVREADATVEGGESFELAGVRFEVLFTPGHSPGGVSLYAPALGLVLAGDTLFQGSIGRYDFPTSDGEALASSIAEKLYALPDETVVLPGHGESTTIGEEKRSNPFVRAEA